MKKIALILLALFLTLQSSTNAKLCQDSYCDWLDFSDLIISGSGGFESRFVYRGSKLAKQVVTSRLEIAHPICFSFLDMSSFAPIIYGGAWGVFPVRNTENQSAQQVNPYGGISFKPFESLKGDFCLPVFEDITLDVGYVRYIFTNTDQNGRTFRSRNTSRQNELYFGASLDFYLHWAAYAFYNFDLEQWVIEPSVSTSIDLLGFFSKDCKHILTFDPEVRGGWLHAKNFNGNQRAAGVGAHENSYLYIQAKADLTFHFNEYASVSGGARYVANNDGNITPFNANGPYTANALDGDDDFFWFGGSLNFSF